MRDAHQDQSIFHSELHIRERLGDQDKNAFYSVWKMVKFEEEFPDKTGTVRNDQVLVKPNQDGSSKYKPSQGYQVKRHVSKLLLLVPVEDQDTIEDDDDVKVENDIVKNDVKVKKVVWDADVCDSMAQNVGSSYNSPEVVKQDEVQAELQEKVDEAPGGSVSASRRSPRFGHTIA